MFIISKRNYNVRRADGSLFSIKKDYIGDIPEDVARSRLVQRAIRGGMIAIPQGKADKQLERADDEAGERAAGNDIRPDAALGTGGAQGTEGPDGPDGPADIGGPDAVGTSAGTKGKGKGTDRKAKKPQKESPKEQGRGDGACGQEAMGA